VTSPGESGVRLAWVLDESDGYWYADMGLLVCCVYPGDPATSTPFEWHVIDREGKTAALADAQLAAESAALALLLEGVAALAGSPPAAHAIVPVPAERGVEHIVSESRGDRKFMMLHALDEAESVGCALIAAAHASRHHGKAGGG
jgi:hypothetical protein